MLKKFALFASLLLLPTLTSCNKGGYKITNAQLKSGGVFVAYSNGCEKGCEKIERGDLIQKVDGKDVATGRDLDDANLTDGAPHKLTVWKKKLPEGASNPMEIEIVAKPSDAVPPIKDAPPFWTTGAQGILGTTHTPTPTG